MYKKWKLEKAMSSLFRGNHIYKKLGERIILARKKKKISQERLAIISELDRTYLARMENGKANPTIKTLFKISRKLRVKVHDLTEDF